MRETSEDIVCFELGSGQSPWVGSTASLEPDRDAIQRLVQDGLIELTERGGESHISGVDRVGLVQLSSGRRLVIRSKIESLVLLEWLTYLGEFPMLEVWLADAGVTTGADFHTCIARLFLYELERLTRLHLRKDYTPIFADEPTIRGRIVTSRLYRKLHRLPHVPQRHRSRTLDTPYNVVLALALDKLPLLLASSTPDDHRQVARLRDLWAHIRRDHGRSGECRHRGSVGLSTGVSSDLATRSADSDWCGARSESGVRRTSIHAVTVVGVGTQLAANGRGDELGNGLDSVAKFPPHAAMG